MLPQNFRQEWLSNVRGDLLAGIVVALALIPEAITFSIIAGVDPKAGLCACFSIAEYAMVAAALAIVSLFSRITNAMTDIPGDHNRECTEVDITGMNEVRATLVDKLAAHDKPDALEKMPEHEQNHGNH